MKRIYLLLIFMFVFSSASGLTYKQGAEINFAESCEFINCSDGNVNLTILDSTGSTIIDNQLMTIENGYVYYGLTPTDISELGAYRYFISSDNSFYSSTFHITATGETSSLSSALVYGILLFITLTLLISCILWFNSLQWDHYKDNEGSIVQVSNDRIKKTVLFFASYMLTLFLFFIGKVMVESIMLTNNTHTVINAIFIMLLSGLAPITLAVVVIAIITTVSDSKLQKGIMRGF